jgi:hypothetical protein
MRRLRLPPLRTRLVFLALRQNDLFLPDEYLHPAVPLHEAGPFLRQGDDFLLLA